MEHTVTTTDIIINLAIQIWQIIIFFGVFIYFFGNKIAAAVIDRQIKEEKLANADLEYNRIIADAQAQAEETVKQALLHKKNILSEVEWLANLNKKKLIEEAELQAKIIIQKAQQEAQNQKRDLESNFELAVKQIAMTTVNKLIGNDTKLQEEYLNWLVKEFSSQR